MNVFRLENRQYTIKCDILIQDNDKGGLRMINFEMVIKSSKLNWFKVYLNLEANAIHKYMEKQPRHISLWKKT